MSGDAARDALCANVDEVIITRGADGAFVGCGDDCHDIAAMPLGTVTDTTGAGDLFAAGYLYGRTNGYSVQQSGVIASIAAGEIISHIGARPDQDLAGLVSKAGI